MDETSEGRFLRYDPHLDEWTQYPIPSENSTTLVAAGDRVVAVNYSDESGESRELVFDLATGLWQPLPASPLGPTVNRQAVWLGERMLLMGKTVGSEPNMNTPATARMAVLNAELTQWSELPESQIIGNSPIVVADRVVFPYSAVFDPETALFTPLPAEMTADFGIWSTFFISSDVAVDDRLFTLDALRLFDPKSGSIEILPALPTEVPLRPMVRASDDTLFVWGTSRDNADDTNDGFLIRL